MTQEEFDAAKAALEEKITGIKRVLLTAQDQLSELYELKQMADHKAAFERAQERLKSLREPTEAGA